jgi:hypothetical protein
MLHAVPPRDRVIATPAPGMASANPAKCQPAAGQRSVGPEGVQGVFGTTGSEAALPQWPEQQGLCRRNHPAIQAHGKDQDMLGRIHSTHSITRFNNRAFRSVVKRSLSTTANGFPAIEGRATSTRSTGAARSCWWTRKLSRRSRRARLRTTAPPIRRPVITPRRDGASAGSRRQFAMRQPRASRSPRWRTKPKSRLCLIRAERQNCRRRGISSAISHNLDDPGSVSAR